MLRVGESIVSLERTVPAEFRRPQAALWEKMLIYLDHFLRKAHERLFMGRASSPATCSSTSRPLGRNQTEKSTQLLSKINIV